MQGMRDMLRGSLARSLRELPDEDRIAAAWPVACGSALAVHGELMGVDAEGVLHIRVDGPEWMRQFLGLKAALVNDLRRIAGVQMQGIHFEEQGRERQRARRSPAAKKPKE